MDYSRYGYDVRPISVRFLDLFFCFILLLLPFERAFVEGPAQGSGPYRSGAFLQYFIIAFAVLSVPYFKWYYKKWCVGIWLYFCYLLVGTFSDARGLGISPFFASVQLRIWIVFYMMVVAYNIARRSELLSRRLIHFLMLFSATVALLQVLGVGTGVSYERGVGGERVSVMGANLNSTARDLALFVFGGFLVFIGRIKISGMKKIGIIAFSVVAFYGILKTGSRGGVAATFFAIPFAIFTTRDMTKKVIYSFVLMFSMAAMCMMALSVPVIRDRIDKTLYDRDTGHRELIFYLTMETWSSKKLLGYGNFNCKFVLGEAVGRLNLATHCTYTNALLASGVVGATFYFIFLIYTLVCAIKIRFRPYGSFVLLVLIMALLGGITMNIEYTKWLYVIYGVIFAQKDLDRQEKRLNLIRR